MIKTVSLTADTETKVEISGGYNVGVINRTTGMLYASRKSGIVAGADDVAAIPAGDSYTIRAADDTVYLLATAAGDVQLESIGAKEVFNIAATRSSSGGGGTVDGVARQAIASHANNEDIHITTDEREAWNSKTTLEESAEVFGNDSLLINGDFSINQRGQTEYTEAGYTVDCWANERNVEKVIINDGYLTFERTELSYNPALYQRVENAAALSGKNITISLSYRTQQAHYRIRLITQTASGDVAELKFTNLPVSEEFTTASYTFAMPEELTALTIGVHDRGVSTGLGAVGDKIDLKWIKGELGDYATSFVPPNPAEELAKCQRYFYRLKPGSSNLFYPAIIAPSNTSYANGRIYLPTPMRTLPTCTISGDIWIETPDNTLVNSEASYIHSENTQYCEFALNVKTTDEAVRGKQSAIVIPIGSYIDFSAEL